MTDTTPATNDVPTVLLVHGAFADSSSWNEVIQQLQARRCERAGGLQPPARYRRRHRLRGDRHPADAGPVLAVGHSHGGATISNAATDAGNVLGLVYVAVFAPDEGETLQDIEDGSTDSVLNTALVPLQYPTGQGSETALEFAIDPAKFHDSFAADLPAERTAVMAVTQRPAAALAFGEPNGRPVWRSLPSWAVVAVGDKAAGAEVVRSMTERAGAKITRLRARM